MIERALLEIFYSHCIRFFWIPFDQFTIPVCACVCVCVCLFPILFIHSREVQKLCSIHLSLMFAAAAVASVVSNSVQPHRQQPTRLPHPWDSPGKNTGVGCHFLLQCMKVKSESEVAQSCQTLSDPMDCSPPGSSIQGIFQASVLEWVVIAFSDVVINTREIIEK